MYACACGFLEWLHYSSFLLSKSSHSSFAVVAVVLCVCVFCVLIQIWLIINKTIYDQIYINSKEQAQRKELFEVIPKRIAWIRNSQRQQKHSQNWKVYGMMVETKRDNSRHNNIFNAQHDSNSYVLKQTALYTNNHIYLLIY